MLSILGLVLGVLLGLFLPVSIPKTYGTYVLLFMLVLLAQLSSLARLKGDERPNGLHTFFSVFIDSAAVFVTLFLGARLGVATEQPLLIVLLLRLMGQISRFGPQLGDWVQNKMDGFGLKKRNI